MNLNIFIYVANRCIFQMISPSARAFLSIRIAFLLKDQKGGSRQNIIMRITSKCFQNTERICPDMIALSRGKTSITFSCALENDVRTTLALRSVFASDKRFEFLSRFVIDTCRTFAKYKVKRRKLVDASHTRQKTIF